MAIQLQGNGGTVAEVDTSWRAARTSLRPLETGALGQYSVNMITGALTGLTANQPLFAARWGDATRLAVIEGLYIGFTTTTAFTTAQGVDFEAIMARSYSTNDSSGTAATLTGNNGKRRTSMGTSLFTDIRISTTGTLTAGTRTLDSQGIAHACGSSTAIGTSMPKTGLWTPDPGADHPFVLAQNEGVVIRMPTAMGAVGVIKVYVQMEWAEVTAY